MPSRFRAGRADEVRQQVPESFDDLRQRAHAFINGYFDQHAKGDPALTDAFRERILGSDAGANGG